MPYYLYDGYCHPELETAAQYALSVGIHPNGFHGDSYTLNVPAGTFTLLDTVVPTDSITFYPPECSPAGYAPWIPLTNAQIGELWSVGLVTLVIVWGIKMAMVAGGKKG